MGAWSLRHVTVSAALIAATAAGTSDLAARQSSDPPALVTLRAYLAAYEPRIAELIAEERFVQVQENGRRRRRTRQVLVSEIGFLRLPGSQVWLGQRRVRRIDGRTLDSGAPTLGELFSAAGDDLFVRAKAIADANARHNLGADRSINVPTLPLDLLDARNAAAFTVAAGATRAIRGHQVQLLTLEEVPPGRLVGFADTRFVRTAVRAWVAPASGTLVEAEIDLFPPVPLRHVRHTIRVAFAADRALEMFVPVELEEQAPGFSGRATYGKFRRFRTSARIVP
jgi:hypothetical protein